MKDVRMSKTRINKNRIGARMSTQYIWFKFWSKINKFEARVKSIRLSTASNFQTASYVKRKKIEDLNELIQPMPTNTGNR